MKEESLALEILRELKLSAHRWFIIAIIELILLVGSNIVWLIFESQFETVTEEQSIIQEQTDTENSNMSGVIN